MNTGILKWAALLAVAVTSSGCVMHPKQAENRSMISAAEFDSMIAIEVKELEPLPVEKAVASN